MYLEACRARTYCRFPFACEELGLVCEDGEVEENSNVSGQGLQLLPEGVSTSASTSSNNTNTRENEEDVEFASCSTPSCPCWTNEQLEVLFGD